MLNYIYFTLLLMENKQKKITLMVLKKYFKNNKVTVGVVHCDIKDFICKAKNIVDNEPNIANIWLVFDKDREPTYILKK